MRSKSTISRRDFIKHGSKVAAGVAVVGAMAPMARAAKGRVIGANDTINIAVVGIKGRGGGLINNFARIKGVKICTLCDVDERVLNKRAAAFEKKNGGRKVKTEYDMRKVFDDKDIDAVVIAVPNHWHALATIWACQAGKHVYVEKPCSHNIWEGRKMIEASRKYDRLVQVGFQNRSNTNVRAAMEFLHSGKLGKIYMARGLCFKPRGSFGKFPDSAVPSGVHYDKWVGPAEMYPFNEGKFHYNWHWHWNTGNGDTGNQGPHQFDIARWGLGQKEHPVKISSHGGYFKFGDVCSQETPNTQTSLFEYADGSLLEFGTRGLYTSLEDDIKIGNLFYGTEGWMHLNGSTWKTYFGRKNKPGPSSTSYEPEDDPMILTGGSGNVHMNNFITALRSGKRSDQTCDIEVGFMSTCLPHLANISYRTGKQIIFDGKNEKCINNPEANNLLTRKYRKPYVMPNRV